MMTVLGNISLYGLIVMLLYAVYVELFIYKRRRWKSFIKRRRANKYYNKSIEDFNPIIGDNIFENILDNTEPIKKVEYNSTHEGYILRRPAPLRDLLVPHGSNLWPDGWRTNRFIVCPKQYRDKIKIKLDNNDVWYDGEYVKFKKKMLPKQTS